MENNGFIIEKIDIAKPGFINIYLTKERMQQEIILQGKRRIC